MNSSYLAELLSGGTMLSELLDIFPDRADLVKSPAVGRKFLLYKSTSFSNTDWGEIKESDYTIAQLARSVPKPILEWARKNAKDAERDLVKDDLKLRFKNPSGTININGVRAALRRLPQVEGVPAEVLAEAKKELEEHLERINSSTRKSMEEKEMPENVTKNTETAGEATTTEVSKADTNTQVAATVAQTTEVAKSEPKTEATKVEGAKETSPESIAKSEFEAMKKSYDAQILEAQNIAKAAQDEVGKLRIEKQQLAWEDKATKEFSHLGKSASDMAGIFMSLQKGGVAKEVIDTVAAIFKSADELIVRGGISESGKSIDPATTSKKEEIIKTADALVKSGTSKTREQAIAKLIKEDPSVLAALEEE